MQDMFEAPPQPSMIKPAAYGAAFGLALTLVFFLAYVIAPGLPLGGTTLIALGFLALLALVLNYVPSRAGDDLAAMAMGDAPAPLSGEHGGTGGTATMLGGDQGALGELELRVTQRREELDAVDRAGKPVEWIAKARDMADALKELGTREMSSSQRKMQKAGLGHLRQAASTYRKVVDTRGKNRSERDWAVAQIALAECQLVLGEAEGARDQVMTSANGFTSALEVGELSSEERRAGENGLAQAEGVLASMAEAERDDGGDEFF